MRADLSALSLEPCLPFLSTDFGGRDVAGLALPDSELDDEELLEELLEEEDEDEEDPSLPLPESLLELLSLDCFAIATLNERSYREYEA